MNAPGMANPGRIFCEKELCDLINTGMHQRLLYENDVVRSFEMACNCGLLQTAQLLKLFLGKAKIPFQRIIMSNRDFTEYCVGPKYEMRSNNLRAVEKYLRQLQVMSTRKKQQLRNS